MAVSRKLDAKSPDFSPSVYRFSGSGPAVDIKSTGGLASMRSLNDDMISCWLNVLIFPGYQLFNS